ncbi:MAG: alanine/glycine:cation symporter family protein [Bacteroidota bacterium]
MNLGDLIIEFADIIWGTPLLLLLIGGGLFFLIHSKLEPLRYFGHAIGVLSGKYDESGEKGDINHFEALSTAIAGTVGMGNIAGVAIAITTGGPGAIFWMWISAVVGVVTNFYTISLAVMFRGKDDKGELQGGPMYVISEGLGKNWRWMGILFSIFAMVGLTPMFNVNQLTQVINTSILQNIGIQESFYVNLSIGIILAILVLVIALGGIKRIAKTASMLVPVMVVFYFIAVLYILSINYQSIIPTFELIITDAFSANSVLGGSVGALIILGTRRGAFSNEAGIGTAAMAHGAAKTNEPIREGLVSMLIPVFDTLIVCTLTALAILVAGVWIDPSETGVHLTMMSFETVIPGYGTYILASAIFVFSFTTLFSFPYYGKKSFEYIFGSKYSWIYTVLYVLSIPVASVVSLKVVLGLIDSAYALMAFPTMISGIILAPKVKKAAKVYFAKYKKNY